MVPVFAEGQLFDMDHTIRITNLQNKPFIFDYLVVNSTLPPLPTEEVEAIGGVDISTGAIVGIVIGVVTGLAALGLVGYRYWRKKYAKRRWSVPPAIHSTQQLDLTGDEVRPFVPEAGQMTETHRLREAGGDGPRWSKAGSSPPVPQLPEYSLSPDSIHSFAPHGMGDIAQYSPGGHAETASPRDTDHRHIHLAPNEAGTFGPNLSLHHVSDNVSNDHISWSSPSTKTQRGPLSFESTVNEKYRQIQLGVSSSPDHIREEERPIPKGLRGTPRGSE